jgi:hypothetical protein
MKHRHTILVTLVALLFCSACNSSSLLSNPDAEAREQAQKFVDAQLARCGDSYFGIRKITNESAIYQFRNPKLSVRRQELTQADKLNGVEWKGDSTFSAEAWRMYDLTGKWTPWQQGFASLDAGVSVIFFKQKGQWKFGSTGDLVPDAYEKVDCSKVPQ